MTFLEFPKDFEWGASTSSYQIEGAWNADGKGESIWDRFTIRPHNIINGDTGDNACNQYEHLLADVKLIKHLGLKTHSSSISWSRLILDGQCSPIPKGLGFYNRLDDALMERIGWLNRIGLPGLEPGRRV
ncbi:MAG: family 1 glycosylhydrolase [Chloroflexi bacterium]|nr:family 1 glycosylhydrolase [Chloroflexota bacterium]